MLNINDIRSIYPEYNGLTDYELATAIHRKRYADMPYEQFAQGFGGPLEEDKVEIAARQYNAANPKTPLLQKRETPARFPPPENLTLPHAISRLF